MFSRFYKCICTHRVQMYSTMWYSICMCMRTRMQSHISTRFHRHDPAYSLQYAASKNVPFLKQQDTILEILKRFPMF